MKHKASVNRSRSGVWIGLGASIVWSGALALAGTGTGRAVVRPSPTLHAVGQTAPSASSITLCQADLDCDDGLGCTSDVCVNGTCQSTAIPDCVSCTPTYTCPPIDVAFLMDTSGSMEDEAATLCSAIGEIVADLEAAGVTLRPHLLGLTETPGGAFSCLTNSVTNLPCAGAGCDMPTCLFPGDPSSFESWGPATTIAARNLSWTPGAARIIVPIADEGPCNGSLPNGCNDPGDDRDSVEEAVGAAVANGIVVSPIVGTGADGCVRQLASDLAAGTGGSAFFTQDAGRQLPDAVVALILSHCTADFTCDDGNFCTRNDACAAGRCQGTPVAGCTPCDTASGPCSDGNACTDEVCVNFVCEATPNFDPAEVCCNPDTGALATLSDGSPCTADLCNPETGSVTHEALTDGTSCDDGLFCYVGEFCTGGVCSGGEPRDCGALNDACHLGICQESGQQCMRQPANEGFPCDDGDVCAVGETCSAGVCNGGTPVLCPDNQNACSDLACDPAGTEGNCARVVPVREDEPCDDGGPCVIGETCRSGVCGSGTPVACPDDGVACTNAVCDPLGPEGNCNSVANVAVGGVCDDGNICTLGDACNGAGSCVGTDVNTRACTGDPDCSGYTCNTATGFCSCSETSTLALRPVPSALPNGCYLRSQTITINVALGTGATPVASGQFFMAYNPQVLRFLAVSPGRTVDPTSPFSQEVSVSVNEITGTVCYSVGVPIGTAGSRGPAIMASLRFRTQNSCTSDEVFFLGGAGGCETTLLGESGETVAFDTQDSGPITVTGNAPSITCPQSVTTPAEPGKVTAEVTWPLVTASGGCGGPIQLTCTATHSSELNIDGLIPRGGRFASGVAEFHCSAQDSCGQRSVCDWTVQVNRTNCVRARVQLSPMIVDGPLPRCVEFSFYSNCVEPPAMTRQPLTFGGLLNLPGRATSMEFEIPAGLYACATARDPLHTIRSASSLPIENGCYSVTFQGDPFFNGNWLVGGNLNGDDVIDILDFGAFAGHGLGSIPAHTTCDSRGPHPDINGDGLIDALDFTFISLNFLAGDTNACCPGSTADAGAEGLTAIAVDELDARGLSQLRAADLNGDGFIDAGDIAAYYEGVRPVTPSKAGREQPR